jgi:hypothetical protein
MKSDLAPPAKSRASSARLAAVALLLTLSAAAPALAAMQAIGGDERLFLGFVEDAAIVRKGWLEAAAHYDDWGDGRDLAIDITTAFRLGRDVEVGLLAGVLDRARDAGSELDGVVLATDLRASGLQDPRLYGKLRFLRGPFEMAAGAGVSLPVADEDRGLGPGVARYAAFLGLRRSFATAAIVGSLGMTTQDDDAESGRAAGRRAGLVGAGVLVPMRGDWIFVGEFRYVGSHYEGGDDDARLLAGLDWRPTDRMNIRGAVAAGMTDGAPPFGAVFAGVFHF